MVVNRIEKHGNTYKGIISALEGLVTKEGASEGFQYLMMSGMGSLTAEHLVENNRQYFSDETVIAATKKLHGWEQSDADSKIRSLIDDR